LGDTGENEAKSVGNVIQKLRFYMPEADILVINDGSTDGTIHAVKDCNANSICLPFNLGIGAAVQTGYFYASRCDYDIAVQVDGDGQHDPSFIKSLIKPLVEGRADMTIGSRYIGSKEYSASFARRIGTVFFSYLIRLLTGKTIKDTTSGFRAINKKAMCYFSQDYPSDYPEVDSLLRLLRRKFSVLEIPVKMYPRQNGKSSITPLYSIYYMLKVCISLLLGNIRAPRGQGGLS